MLVFFFVMYYIILNVIPYVNQCILILDSIYNSICVYVHVYMFVYKLYMIVCSVYVM